MPPSTKAREVTDLSKKLKELVDREEDAQYEENLKNASEKTVADLAGTRQSVWTGLDIASYSSEYTLQTAADSDVGLDEYFYPDHIVAIRGDRDQQANDIPDSPLVATVNTSNPDYVSVSPAEWYSYSTLDDYQDWLDATTDATIIEIYHPRSIEREREAIERLGKGGYRSLTLSSRLDFLSGKRDTNLGAGLADDSSYHDMLLYKNDEQEEAIRQALNADPFACIHGPPGTGKTRVIVEIIRRLAELGKSVLLTADSNPATDNALFGGSDTTKADPNSLAHYAEGSPSHQDELDVFRFNAHNSSHRLLGIEDWFDPSCSPWTADVVVTTNNSAGKLADMGRKFDYAVIDEAAQATLPSAAIPYSISNHLILVGDHEQLPPFRHSDIKADPDDLPLSMFEYLYGPNSIFGTKLGVQLKTQYRMHSDIASLPNSLTYDGEISSGVSREPVVEDTPIRVFDVTSRNSPNEKKKGYSTENRAEALCCGIEANYLLEQGLDPHDIGIATPYRAQVRALNEALADVGIDAETREKIYYDTISGFQGSERTAMICSFVRSNRDGNVGFLESHDGPNRLNVGLSRAKRHLTVIGDWSTLINHPLYEQLHDLLTKQTKPIAREGTQIVDRHQ